MIWNIDKYVGIIHLCGMIVEDIYGFIIRKNTFLINYILLVLCLYHFLGYSVKMNVLFLI